MQRRSLLLAAAVLAAHAAAQAPSNNSCSAPLTVFAGVNPQPPNGSSGQYFTNVNATNSSSSAFGVECAPAFNKDVWFAFTPTKTGTHQIQTCTPSGFTSGSLTETVVAIYEASACPSGAVDLACNDDNTACNIFGSSRSSVNVNLWQGHDYLIRVGTESASASGTFYLEIVEPTTAANNLCTGAIDLVLGANSGTFDGATGSSTTYGCTAFSVSNADVWFKYEGSLLDVLNGVEVAITGSSVVDFMAVYTGTCSIIPPSSFNDVDCGTNVVQFAPGFQTYWIRVGRGFAAEPSLGFTLTMTKIERPSNDHCTSGFTTFGGVGPAYAALGVYYNNEGALDTNFGATTSCVSNTNSDVWYDYIATTSGKVVVTTDTPSGYAAGTLTDTVVAVFAACGGGPPIACDDNAGVGLLSYLEFEAVQGVHYKVMVAGKGQNLNTEGSFWLTIVPKFRLTMSAPLGPGSIQFNLTEGGPFQIFFTCLTLQQGNYPYGPFFGIEPTVTEIALQINSASEPFLGILNGSGGYQFGPIAGLPSGLTLYGVSLEFDAIGQISGVTPMTTFTIP